MIQDLKVAARTLLRQPGFTGLALTILAVGLGAAIAMFSLMNTLLLRPLPYPDGERLVRVYRTVGVQRAWPHSVPSFLDHRAQNTVFAGMAAFEWRSFSVAEPGQPAERLRGMDVTGDFFAVLGVQPRLGRAFLPEEEQHKRNQVVMLSDALWRSRFAADPSIIGRQLRLEGELVTVVGVMPAAFDYPIVWGVVDLWRPFGFSPAIRQARNDNWLQAIARLAPGVTLAQAQAEMSALALRMGKQQPNPSGLRLLPLHRSGMDETGTRLTWLSMGLSLFVLLIVCINLAGVQLARLAGRAREYAIRAALGATRGRLVRQALAESLLLALGGGALGVLVARWCTDLLSARILIGGRAGVSVPLDGRVLVFALAVALATALVVGLLPGWSTSRTQVGDALKGGGRGVTDRSRPLLRQGLVVAELALALVLLAMGGLFLRGLQRFVEREPGWKVDGLLTAEVNLPAAKYTSAEQRAAFFQRLEERLRVLPGVEHAAVAWELPVTSFPPTTYLAVEGAPVPPGQEPRWTLDGVTPDFFATLGIPVIAGRPFSSADGAATGDVVIINEALARHAWPGQSALGKRIARMGSGWSTVVGVVGDIRLPAKLSAPVTRFQGYRPLAQGARHGASILVRGQGADLRALAPAVRRAVADLDPDVPIQQLGTARQVVDQALANFSLTGRILLGFALVGLLLAGLGVYGLFAGFVVQRTREIGVRVALGADAGQVLRLVMGKGLRLAVVGAALGLVAAAAAVPMLTAAASELPAAQPFSVVALALVLIAVALFACWLPARRAAALDPMVALRQE
jgi:putative ABC transport system permease protein